MLEPTWTWTCLQTWTACLPTSCLPVGSAGEGVHSSWRPCVLASSPGWSHSSSSSSSSLIVLKRSPSSHLRCSINSRKRVNNSSSGHFTTSHTAAPPSGSPGAAGEKLLKPFRRRLLVFDIHLSECPTIYRLLMEARVSMETRVFCNAPE